jgi:predicted ATPase/DNA-binding SARP family transcriptional activator/tRNA A-37 threonylcarbamoyl transferase component Bud32
LLRLKTFGGLSLESDRGALGGAAAQRRRLSVLAILASAGSRGLTRDKLIGLLWPEVDEARARSALSQALYALRRDTGEAELVVGYDRLALNECALTSDVAELEDAVARGDLAHAVSLYAGAFLDGVHLDDAPEFEHWLDEVRLRFSRIAERALERLATEARSRRDHAMAAQWWGRLTALDPLHPVAVLGSMEALVESGDRAGALRQAERYEQRAHEELGSASPDVVALADTLRGERDAQCVTGRFVLECELGRSEAGVVHLARDTKHDRRVALTMLHPETSASIGRDRLEHEIRIAARLQHPHILPLHDFGEWADTLFYVTPFVDGESLRARLLIEPRLTVPEAVTIAQEMAGALDHAHRHGVTHGNVKPENILLADGHAMLIELGIARATSDVRDAEDGARHDVFRLGCVIYEMLAGRMPSTSASAPSLRKLRGDTPPWLDELVQQMLGRQSSGRPLTAGDVTRALATGASAPPSRLPVAGDAMIGRDAELAAACAALGRNDVTLLTLTGPGGVGKTRLAVQAARERESHFDRVYFVDLAPVRDAGGVAPAIAAAVGLPLQSDRNPLDAFVSACAGRRTLLVLDNFEQVVSAAPTLARLMADAPTLKLLITSRMRLDIRGEHELRVSPLSVPEDGAAAPDLRESAAVRLFVRRALDASATLVFDDESIRAAARICARLDGLPLAIELAAARCRLMSPRTVARRLDTGLGLLSRGSRSAPERHQTMRQAIAWSYALLTPDEQRLFVRMAIFAGGCTLAAAEAVCADASSSLNVLDGIGALVDASALVRDAMGHDGEPRLRMLETVREFARESLAGNPEAVAVARRHAAWYLRLATSLAPQLTGEAQHEALTTLAEDHANLSAALEHSLETGDAESSLAFGAALWRYWLVRGHLAEGRALLARGLALPDSNAARLAALRADAMTGAGHLAQNSGAFGEASQHFQSVLEMRRRLGDRAGMASALADLGWMRWRQCDLPEARRLSAESLRIAEQLGETRVAALALTNLGATALYEGKFAEAREAFTRSAGLRAQVADHRGVAFANMLLGWTMSRDGALEEARRLLEESEETLRAIGDRRLIYFARDVRAEVFLREGNAARAAEIMELDSISGLRRFGDRWGVAHGLAVASWATRLLGDNVRAIAFAEESLEIRRAVGDLYGEAESLALLAASARATGDDRGAVELVQASRAIRAAIGDAAGLAECDAELSLADVPA